ncbi:MAG TPA: flagellar assembly protein FliH [Spirochaetia bacterium]|nr:flagellar assembly protein FliH [Spirochaetia bacterium]
MAKHVFRPTEVINLSRKIFIEPPRLHAEEPEALALEDLEAEYEGPTAEDLRREAESFRENWEKEKEQLIAQARAEADRIIKEAEQVAFEEIKNKNNQAKKIRQEAETEAERILNEAREKAEEAERKTGESLAAVEKEAFDKGHGEGHDNGYQAGSEEVGRLTERLHMIITKAIEKRNQIIDDSETQLIGLVLMIANKVIKVISENQRNVVINNVIQALRKLKSRGDVVIRVNLADLKLTTEHTRDFMDRIENIKSITILEDSSVDRGGCIIETDFGQIDARISSQLKEIEERIMEMMPIKTRGGESGST